MTKDPARIWVPPAARNAYQRVGRVSQMDAAYVREESIVAPMAEALRAMRDADTAMTDGTISADIANEAWAKVEAALAAYEAAKK